jgi:hypothetical protein
MRRPLRISTLMAERAVFPPNPGDNMRLLLLLPFIGLLAVPMFNTETPEFAGFPFFYWYMFAWVPLTSLLIWLVNRNEKPEE